MSIFRFVRFGLSGNLQKHRVIVCRDMFEWPIIHSNIPTQRGIDKSVT